MVEGVANAVLFQFQSGSSITKKLIISLKPQNMFQFQSGSSITSNSEFRSTFLYKFQFQSGSSITDRKTEVRIERVRRFNSNLVQVLPERTNGLVDDRLRFNSNLVQVLQVLYRFNKKRNYLVSIPIWFKYYCHNKNIN